MVHRFMKPHEVTVPAWGDCGGVIYFGRRELIETLCEEVNTVRLSVVWRSRKQSSYDSAKVLLS